MTIFIIVSFIIINIVFRQLHFVNKKTLLRKDKENYFNYIILIK